jgi:hypothetical protein
MDIRPPDHRLPTRVISGGQTGVDRAALDAAKAAAIPIGGWCPAGRTAEDGPIPSEYPLRETASRDYSKRTRLNVRDADATLILHRGPIAGGTALTADYAAELGRPLLLVNLDTALTTASVTAWLEQNQVQVLNVAGPRESTSPGIAAMAAAFLRRLFSAIPDHPEGEAR